MINKSVMSDDKDDLNQLVILLSAERGTPASRAKEIKLADASSDPILHSWFSRREACDDTARQEGRQGCQDRGGREGHEGGVIDMAAAPLHSFREGDVYNQISRFEQRQGSQEEEEDDGHSPSPPPGPAMELPSRLYECKSVVRALDVSSVSLGIVILVIALLDLVLGIVMLD